MSPTSISGGYRIGFQAVKISTYAKFKMHNAGTNLIMGDCLSNNIIIV